MNWYCEDCEYLEYEKGCLFNLKLFTKVFCFKHKEHLMIRADGKEVCRLEKCKKEIIK